jgi:hypothetical protein
VIQGTNPLSESLSYIIVYFGQTLVGETAEHPHSLYTGNGVPNDSALIDNAMNRE